MKTLVKANLVFASLLGFSASSALAWDAQVQGEIIMMEVANGENFGFRIWLRNSGPNCGAGTESWSYLNASDSNYNVYVSALMMARTMKTPVTVYTNQRGIYCWIEHLVF